MSETMIALWCISVGLLLHELFGFFRLLSLRGKLRRLQLTPPSQSAAVASFCDHLMRDFPVFEGRRKALFNAIQFWGTSARLNRSPSNVLGDAFPRLPWQLDRQIRLSWLGIVLAIGLALCSDLEQLTTVASTVILILGVLWTLLQLVDHQQTRLRYESEDWLSNLLPPLPESQEVTRDLMLQLNRQIQAMEASNRQALGQMTTAQETLSDLGLSLRTAFRGAVQEELSPTLAAITAMADRVQAQNQEFLQTAVVNQNAGVQTIVDSVMLGIDQVVGASLRNTSDSFAQSVQRQQVSMDRWRRSVETVSTVVSELQTTAAALNLGAERMAQAALPVEAASVAFSASAQELQSAIPAITEVSTIYQQANSSLTQAHTAIELGTQRYLEASNTVRTMLDSLAEAHGAAVDRVQEGVDAALLEPMRLAGQELVAFQGAQQTALAAWADASQAIGGTAQDLITAATEMATAAAALGEMESVATTFQQASGQMAVVVPEMTRAAEAHSQGREAIIAATTALDQEGARYLAAGEQLTACAEALNVLYEQATERIAVGVDSAIAEPLAAASAGLVQAVELMDARLLEHGSQSVSLVEDATTRIATQLEESSQSLAQSLIESTVGLSTELNTARIGISDTMREHNTLLGESLQAAGSALQSELSGASGGLLAAVEELRGTMLDNTAQQAELATQTGANIQQLLESGVESWAETAELAAQSLLQGAQQAQQQLGTASSSWGEEIAAAAATLRSSASHIETSSSTAAAQMTAAFAGSDQQLQASLSAAGEQMVSSMTAVQAELSSAFSQAATEMRLISDAQSTQLTNLSAVSQTLAPALVALNESAHQLNELVTGFRDVIEPTAAVANTFHAASQELSVAFPAIEATNQRYLVLNQALESAAVALSDSGSLYSDAGAGMRQLLDEIQQSLSLQQESNQTVTATLASAEQTILSVAPTAESVQGLVQQLETAMLPAAAAADNFRTAATEISAIFPSLTESSENYTALNESLTSAAATINASAEGYRSTSAAMNSLLERVHQGLELQANGAAVVTESLQQVTQTVQVFEPVSIGLRDTARDIATISQQTAGTITQFQQTTTAQQVAVEQMNQSSQGLLNIVSAQSEQIQAVTSEMQRLQEVLTVGVQAFAQQLPTSVDRTLVQFDTALGEGVVRIGAAIERLREAMDDLVESMDNR